MAAFAVAAANAAPLELVDMTVSEGAGWSYKMNEDGDCLLVSNSTLTAAGEVKINISRSDSFLRKRLPVTIVNSAITSTAEKISFPITQHSNHTTDVHVVRSSVSSFKPFHTGMWGNGWGGELIRLRAADSTFAWPDMTVYWRTDAVFTNCTIIGTSGDEGGFGSGISNDKQPSTVMFRDCTITNWTPYLGRYQSITTNLCVVSGGWMYLPGFKFGSYPGKLKLTDGVDVKILPSEQNFGKLNGSGSELEVADGATVRVMPKSGTSNRNCYFGWSSGYETTLRIAGGEWTDRNASLLYFGQSGCGRLVVESGAVESQSFDAAGAASASGVVTSYIYQVGGRITANVNGGRNKWSVVRAGFGSTHYGHVILEGGVMQTPRLYGRNDCGYLTANGGTVEPWWDINADFAFIYGFARAEVGAKGLTVDTKTCTARVAQDFTNIEGQQGVFRKVGANLLQLDPPSSWDVAVTRVEEGTLQIVKETETLNTELVITNGAILSLSGAAESLALDALTVENGVIEIDVGDTIAVPADRLKLVNLSVRFTTAPSTGSETSFLVTTGGELSEHARRMLLRTALDNAIGAGTTACVRFDYDSATGRTTMRMAVRENAEPLTDETVWQSGATWTTGSWSDGAPTASKIATFNASASVLVDDGAEAGALAFEGAAVLSGSDPIEIASGEGAAKIETRGAGTANVAAPIVCDSSVALATTSGSKLLLSGNVESAGFDKTGKGELELAGTNAFFRSSSSADGRLLVRSAAALDADPEANQGLTLKGGTLTFDEPEGREIRLTVPVTVSTPEVRGSAVVECRTPVTFADWRATEQGGFIKRGQGRLTIEARDGMSLSKKLARSASTYVPRNPVSFDADGSSPDGASLAAASHYYGEFNVAEGELAIVRPAGMETRPTVSESYMIMPSLVTTTGTAKPRLILDGVDMDNSAATIFTLSADLTSDRVFDQSPELVLLNDARLYANQLRCLYYGYSAGCRPVWAVTNSTLQAKTEFWLAWINVSGAYQSRTSAAVFRTKNAKILADTGVFKIDGGVDGDFASSDFGPTEEGACAEIVVPEINGHASRASGTMLFRDGSVFRVNKFTFPASEWKPNATWSVMRFAFDGATWDFGDGDFTLRADWIAEDYRDKFVIETSGEGLRLAPAAGATFATELPITGTGPLVVAGAGTVRLSASTLKFTGGLVLDGGTFDACGATLPGNVCGSGTVQNVTFAAGSRLKLEVADDWASVAAVPTFDGCAFPNGLIVDCGRDESNPLPLGGTVTVAHFVGAAPDVSNWRLAGVGRRSSGAFTVEGDAVKVTAGSPLGFSIIFR